jgi:hypothetical protein
MKCLLWLTWVGLASGLIAHIIPHSHCDPGVRFCANATAPVARRTLFSLSTTRPPTQWLETFEGYYQTQVNTILNSVVDTVSQDPARRFVWAESSFLMRWYEVATEARRALLRSLVASGQVEFVGGGWVQNDEANPDYGAVISQLTEGHEYLAQLFGTKPRFFWQLDPFGHAAATPALAAAAGFEALVVNRIDHSVKDALKARGALEFWWAPYGGNASASSILTHVLHSHYSAPKGYDFENPEGYPVGDGASVTARAAGLVAEIRGRARAYRTEHILVPFGDDFKFQFAPRQFENMDKLVAAINVPGAFPGFSIRYSTLSEYFDAVGGALRGAPPPAPPPLPLPVYGPRGGDVGGVDFFPYADNVHSYWAGYFVSRPSLKAAIRTTTALLRGADALLALVRPGGSSGGGGGGGGAHFSWLRAFQRLEQVRLDVALCLHHDAITGTSREHVVADYAKRMAEGGADALTLIADVASLRLAAGGGAPPPLTAVPHVLPLAPLPAGIALTDGVLPPDAPAHPVTLFNALAWKRTHLARVAVDLAGSFSDARCGGGALRWPRAWVTDDAGAPVAAQWAAVPERVGGAPLAAGAGAPDGGPRSALLHFPPAEGAGSGGWHAAGVRYELVWAADLPPLSLRTFFVTLGWPADGGGGAEGDCAAVGAPLPPLPGVAEATSAAVVVPAAAAGGGGAPVGGAVALPPTSALPAGDGAPLVLENACLRLEADAGTGLLLRATRKVGGGSGALAVPLAQAFKVYNTRQSGAYIFRPVDAPVELRNGAGVVVSASVGGDAADGGAPLEQRVRTVGDRFSQTLRLTNTLRWRAGGGAPDAAAEAACEDPIHPDAGFDVIPTVTANDNEEVVMELRAGIAAWRPGAGAAGAVIDGAGATNLREVVGGALGGERGGGSAATPEGAPIGWWTSDGLGLLRRSIAVAGLPPSEHQKHFYPLNTMTRVSGSVPGGSAWLSLFTQQPFGAFAGAYGGGEGGGGEGVALTVMLHRNLGQDDGRGLSSSVSDRTVLTPALRATLGATPVGTQCCRSRVRGGGAPPGGEEWGWKWAAAAAAHTTPVVALHADLGAAAGGGRGAVAPPEDPLLLPGRSAGAPRALAEAGGVPRGAWLRGATAGWESLCGGRALPPHVLLQSLAARDAVSDDVVLRLQHLGRGDTGGPVEVPPIAGGFFCEGGERGFAVTSAQHRSLTLLHAEAGSGGGCAPGAAAAALRAAADAAAAGAAAPARALAAADLATLCATPPDAVAAALAELADGAGEPRGVGGGGGGGDALSDNSKQNTEEEGVFISDAAVAKAKADAAARGGARVLLDIVAEAPAAGGGGAFSLAPNTIRTVVLTLEGGGGAGGGAVLAAPLPPPRAGGGGATRSARGGGAHAHAGSGGAPILPPAQRATALLELLPLLDTPPAKQLKAREALLQSTSGGRGAGARPGALPGGEEAALFRATLRLLSARVHDTEEELELPDALDEVLLSLMAGGRVGGVLREAAAAKRKLVVGPMAVPGAGGAQQPQPPAPPPPPPPALQPGGSRDSPWSIRTVLREAVAGKAAADRALAAGEGWGGPGVVLAPSAPPRSAPRPAFDKLGGGGNKGVRAGVGGWAREQQGADDGGRVDADALFARAALLTGAVAVMGVGVGVAWALQRGGGAGAGGGGGGGGAVAYPVQAASLLPLRAPAPPQLPTIFSGGGGGKKQGKAM